MRTYYHVAILMLLLVILASAVSRELGLATMILYALGGISVVLFE